MPCEGPSLANQNGRKLEVFVWKLEGSHSPFYIDILINIRENVTIMFKVFLVH